MVNIKTDIEAFVRAFEEDAGGRERLINDLVKAEGRLLLNLPGRGAARLISERLKEGAFSALYDFEMLLARRLHPRLADLKLNIIADLTVNSFFDERYRPYAAEASIALARRGGMSRMREVVTRMAAQDGHRMVIKFLDLVVRWADPALYRIMRPVEAGVAGMKEGRGPGTPLRFDRISELYEELAAKEGEEAAGALLARMEWDAGLRGFVPGLEEAYRPGAAAQDGDAADWDDDTEAGFDEGDAAGGEASAMKEEASPADDAGAEPGEEESVVPDDGLGENEEPERTAAEHAVESRTEKYARILRDGYLDSMSSDDEAGIRQLIEKIEEKNGKAFGKERAAEIVDEVLALWAADDTIDSGKRELVRKIQDERNPDASGGQAEMPGIDDTVMMDEKGPDGADAEPTPAPAEEEPVTTGEMEALLNELTSEAAGGTDQGESDIIDEGSPAGPGMESGKDTIPEDAEGVLAGLDAEISAGDAEHAVQDSNEDGFLIEDLIQADSGGEKNEAGGGADDIYLIDRGSLVEIPAEEKPDAKENAPAQESGKVNPIEEFTIKDEILFQDNPDKKRKIKAPMAKKGMRITKIDISEPDES